MKKLLTDMHSHSMYSFDSQVPLEKMLDAAIQKRVVFFGSSEHFDYDLHLIKGETSQYWTDAEEYFHGARHLQDDYAGCINFLVGAEFGYCDDALTQKRCMETYEKYKPDFIINSVHGMMGRDYYYKRPFEEGERLRPKAESYGEYLDTVRKSLDVPYHYDIVGHFGYLVRYAPYEDRGLTLAEFGDQIDDILKTIIKKDKILEVNSSTKGLDMLALPGEEILRRYYELGGRKVSFGADAHNVERIAEKREEVVALLKQIGFTHVTVPCRGEHIEIEI